MYMLIICMERDLFTATQQGIVCDSHLWWKQKEKKVIYWLKKHIDEMKKWMTDGRRSNMILWCWGHARAYKIESPECNVLLFCRTISEQRSSYFWLLHVDSCILLCTFQLIPVGLSARMCIWLILFITSRIIIVFVHYAWVKSWPSR